MKRGTTDAFILGIFGALLFWGGSLGAFTPLEVRAETSAVSNASSTSETPFDQVKVTCDELVAAVKEFPGEDKLTERRAKLRTIITPRFDFNTMAQASLGAHWKEISDEERQEFVAVFSDLLAKTYLSRIENIKENTVKVESEKLISADRALVNTEVTHKGETFPINYRLLKSDGKWRVYDVIIENIGLVLNYRNEFSGIIRKEQFSGLMKKLRAKQI